MEKKVINTFRLRITKNGKTAWYDSTLYDDGTVVRKEIKKNV